MNDILLNFVVCSIFCVILLLVFGRKKLSSQFPSSRSVYLLGLAKTRRTELFYYLQGRRDIQTTVSISTNEAEFNENEKVSKVIDLPSCKSSKLYLTDNICSGDKLVFEVDCSSKENIYTSCSLMYEIFVEPWFAKLRPEVLILSLKTEKFMPIVDFEKEVELEFNRLKFSRRTSLHEGNTNDYLASITEDFKIDHVQASNLRFDVLDLQLSAAELKKLILN